MKKGFDCACVLDLKIASLFRADGCDFVFRYLSDGWKGITKSEAVMLQQLGFEIGTVFERGGQRADIAGSVGSANGIEAFNLAKKVGQPEGSAIYFAVDYDAQRSDMDNIYAYLKAAEENIPGYEVGCYGSFAVVEEMHRRGIKHLWQTLAWSGGKVSKFANIYQSDNDVTVHGIGIDNDISFGGEGWWSTMDDILKQLTALASRVTTLEQATKVLEKTQMPDWFVKEFGTHSLDGIVTDLTGDTDFWRDTAIILREFKAKNL